MKLINRTYLYALLWLLPITVVGAIFCYVMIKQVLYEEADEFLTYEMHRVQTFYDANGYLPEYMKIDSVIPNMQVAEPRFHDTLLIEPADQEYMPHRELYFSIHHKGNDFGIVLRYLMPGNDDIQRGSLMIAVGFFVLMALLLLLFINTSARKIWKPFYGTLQALQTYSLGSQTPQLPQTDVEEFAALNQSVNTLIQKISYDYQQTKSFNENASHELQTHLAVIRAKSEALLNANLSEQNLQHVLSVHQAATQLSQVQKSLLLLSKIANQEYNHEVRLDLHDTLSESLSLFDEHITMRHITVSTHLSACPQLMDAGLAKIMTDNLVKNAVRHNVDGGSIEVNLTPHALTITNSGVPFEGNADTLFDRFVVGKTGHIGLGLAIVKQICDHYNFVVSYTPTQTTHTFSIKFS